MSRFFVLPIFLILIGCAGGPRIENPITEVDLPAANVVSAAELGATVIEKGRYRVVDAVVSPNDIVWGDGLLALMVTIPAGVILAEQRDANYTYFFSNRTTAHDAIEGDRFFGRNAALRISNSNFLDVRAIVLPAGFTFEITPPPQLTKTQVFLFDRDGYRQQLVYGGRVGSILRFQYRSAFGDGTQPRSNQDFEWNLQDGTVVSYLGARIEVLESTNARLSYRVLSSFTEGTPQP